MPYDQFKIEELKTKLNLEIKNENWLPLNYPLFEQDELLNLLLKRSQKLLLRTEKARSEFLIAPVLDSFYERNLNKLSLFSGQEFNVDKSKLFHEQKNISNNIIYGCVTSGFVWVFLKLENNILTIDPNYIALDFHDPYKVLSVLQYLLTKPM